MNQPKQDNNILEEAGVYSDSQIKAALKRGQIVCYPLNKEQINPASINVTLGEWYYTTEYDKASTFYNPFSKKEVDHYFAGPHRAVEHHVWARKTQRQLFENIPRNQRIIVLEPYQRILAHSHEFIGIKDGASSLHARSTWGRNGVAVCIDAGWGDPGYINRWTMEIYNLNQRHSVILPVGEQLAQLVFHHCGTIDESYELVGKYQSSGNLKKLIETWRPESMLPKAYKKQPAQLKKIQGLKTDYGNKKT